MKFFLTPFITIISITAVFSQQTSREEITTEEQNQNWLDEFQQLGLNGQIQQLKDRLAADEDIYYTFRNPHGDTPLKEGFQEITYSRPVYVFSSTNSEILILPNNPSKELIREVTSVLKPENVASITYSDDVKSQALYGARARHGVLTINLKNEEHLKRLKAANR